MLENGRGLAPSLFSMIGTALSSRLLCCLGVSTGIHLALLAVPLAPKSGLSVGAVPPSTRLAATLARQPAVSSVSRPAAGDEISPSPVRSDAGAPEERRETGHKSVENALALGSEPPYYNSWEVDVRALPIVLPELHLPEFILRERVVGKVTLSVLISAVGRVDRIDVLTSSHPGLLEEEALRAVNAIRFAPAMKGGVPVRSAKQIEVVFDAVGPIASESANSLSLPAASGQ